MTPLHDAAQNGHLPVIEYLVSREVDVEVTDVVSSLAYQYSINTES